MTGGRFRPRRRGTHRYREIIGRLVAEKADGIVLGCTEIELLVTADDSPVPVLATTQLHVTAAVDEMLRDRS